jgi:cell division protease FtsH
MSERLGPLSFVGPDGGRQLRAADPFLGRAAPVSEATAEILDAEVSALVRGAYTRARDLLRAHRDGLTRLAALLRTRETLEGEELKKALADAVGTQAAEAMGARGGR